MHPLPSLPRPAWPSHTTTTHQSIHPAGSQSSQCKHPAIVTNQSAKQLCLAAQTAPIRVIPALVFFLPALLLIYLAPPILLLLVR